jgi:16S rRNA (cytidine1402-2'-O)-methyltransferase
MIIYESPRRIVKTLEQMCEAFGEGRKISACREISKIHEESVRGTMREVLNHFIANEPRGEFVLIVEGCSTPTKEASHPNHEEEEAKPMSKYQRKQAKLANNS